MHRRHEPTNVPIEILRSLVVILDRGSFTNAARELALTQSAISAQMKRLKSILSDDVFEPGKLNITLTKRGEWVASFARRIVAMNDQLIGGFSAESRVGISMLYSGSVLRKIVSSCREAGLDGIRYHCDTSTNLLKRFEAGHLDAVLILSSSPRPDARAGWSEPMVWTSSKSFEHDPSKPLPWLSWPGSAEDEIAQHAFRLANTRYETVFVAADLTSHMQAVSSGLGYRLMPLRAAPADVKIADAPYLPSVSHIHFSVMVGEELAQEKAETLTRCLQDAAR
ncbi:LysR family transcriptional regulator [Rhodoplanes sp. Z2-YC6860]|uniref:LysR family transcriptional regulator n=1 Tax=Rhodoplanes sp. Z2-YC6860 TaxID=674703 RepID=UPI00078E2076|nr:LysR family transcriptional regulator [Rhodoplanes sp. Z2-YC6860]AMN41408.1 LysR family transcriptional regulator [Rhodoplanes sp. Z2-YC6860]